MDKNTGSKRYEGSGSGGRKVESKEESGEGRAGEAQVGTEGK